MKKRTILIHFFRTIILVLATGFLSSCDLLFKTKYEGTLVVVNNTYQNASVFGVKNESPYVPSLETKSFFYSTSSSIGATAGPYSKTVDRPQGYQRIVLP